MPKDWIEALIYHGKVAEGGDLQVKGIYLAFSTFINTEIVEVLEKCLVIEYPKALSNYLDLIFLNERDFPWSSY